MTLNFDPVTQSQWEIWEWLHSKISLWNTDAPSGNKVKILQNTEVLYVDTAPTLMGIWCQWRASNSSMNLQFNFGFFKTTQTSDIAIYISDGIIDKRTDTRTKRRTEIQLHVINAPANLSCLCIKLVCFGPIRLHRKIAIANLDF